MVRRKWFLDVLLIMFDLFGSWGWSWKAGSLGTGWILDFAIHLILNSVL
jgi:hypothetical protein